MKKRKTWSIKTPLCYGFSIKCEETKKKHKGSPIETPVYGYYHGWTNPKRRYRIRIEPLEV